MRGIVAALAALLALGVFFFRSAAPSSPPSAEMSPEEVAQIETEVRRDITSRLEDYRTAAQHRDAQAAASLFASDAVLLEPGVAVTGGEIASLHEGALENVGSIEYDFEIGELFVHGDVAYTIHVETVTVHSAGQEPVTMASNAFVRWTKEDGVWKIHRAVVGPRDAPAEG